MIERNEAEIREMVPRWLPLEKAIHTGEFSSAKSVMKNDKASAHFEYIKRQSELSFELAENNWSRSKGEIEAQELVAAAVVCNQRQETVQEAARLLLEDSQTSSFMRPALMSFLGESGVISDACDEYSLYKIHTLIAQRKLNLRINPDDVLSAAEMALFYAYLGQSKRAKRGLERAAIQAPNNRYVLRAVARLSAHMEDPDLGLYYLQRTARSEVDPWLASAKLALTRLSGRSVAKWRQLQSIVTSDTYHPRSISELSAQLGTLAVESGSRKKGVLLFKRSIVSPTENTIAQLEHVNRKYSLGILDRVSDSEFMDSDEAVAHKMLSIGKVTLAVEACEAWACLEPFSSDPAVFGSFIASITGSAVDRGIKLIDMALLSNQKDEKLLNNRAVLLALADRTDEALECISKCSPSSDDGGATFWATTGLISMRSGKFDLGLSEYERSITVSRDLGKPLVAFRASLFLFREIIRISPSLGPEINRVINDNFKLLKEKNVEIPIDIVLLAEVIEETAAATGAQGDNLQLFGHSSIKSSGLEIT